MTSLSSQIMEKKGEYIPPFTKIDYEKVSNASLNSFSEGEICDSDFSPVREPIESKFDASRPSLTSMPSKTTTYKNISPSDIPAARLPFMSLPSYMVPHINTHYETRPSKHSANYCGSSTASPYSRSISKSPRRRSHRRSRSPSFRRRSRSTSKSPLRRNRSRSPKRRRRSRRSRSKHRRKSRSISSSQRYNRNDSRHKSRSSSRSRASKSRKKNQYYDHDACRSPFSNTSPVKRVSNSYLGTKNSPLKEAVNRNRSPVKILRKDIVNSTVNKGIDSRLKSIPSFASQMSGDNKNGTEIKITEAELNKKMESFIKHLSRDQRPSPYPQFINLVEDSPSNTLPEVCKSRPFRDVKKQIVEQSIDSFRLLNRVGRGTYGDVYKAVEVNTGELKALKFVHSADSEDGFPLTAIREIKLLRQLRHKNIVLLKDIIQDGTNAGTYLVFEYMEHDLKGLLESGLIEFQESHIAYIIKQILEALNHCHMHCIMHRDVKCANVLLNNRCEVKLADFNLSRIFTLDSKQRSHTPGVVSLWYRAPELILSSSDYFSAVDIWSTGCILGELFMGKPLFEASSEAELIDKIAKLCGSLIASVWPSIINLPGFASYKPTVFHRRKLKTELKILPTNALELLDSMLQLDPEKRCSAAQAIKSDWLSSFDPKSIQLPRLPVSRDCHEFKENNETNTSSHLTANYPLSIPDSHSHPSSLPVSSNTLPTDDGAVDQNINQKIKELIGVLEMAGDSNMDQLINVIEENAKMLDETKRRVLVDALKSHIHKRKNIETKPILNPPVETRNSMPPSESIFSNWQSALYTNEDSSNSNQNDLTSRPTLFETFNNPPDNFDPNEHSNYLQSQPVSYTNPDDISTYTPYKILSEAEIDDLIQGNL